MALANALLSRAPLRAAALALLAALAPASVPAAGPPQGEWNFTVLLDGKPIGTHRFELRNEGGGVRSLTSDARMDVKLFGLTVYRYRHSNRERWNGDCLSALSARTDDDGKLLDVRAGLGERGFTVEAAIPGRNDAPRIDSTAASCAMSFAYWNPSLATQRQLLDPGSGRFEAVDVSPLPPTSIEVHGRPRMARGLRIGGLKHPIDVWYVDDQWCGLDSVVDHGRRLSYRLP